ncbi:hypothetical protein [Natronorubrum halophilum]|uniref:hypothetical protein n=1 Tax=Natronorubrum halophilum TaxID=1702106 RepID=UPI000EF7213E|nr:hypothetical protein [Natronorubrum halophilum]
MTRLPSVREPSSFFDIFTVTAVSITVVAVILAVWHGSFVRLEMGVFVVLVFIWVIWAITHILEEATR